MVAYGYMRFACSYGARSEIVRQFYTLFIICGRGRATRVHTRELAEHELHEFSSGVNYN